MNQGTFRLVNLIGYLFYILFAILNLIWFFQVKFNICRKPRRREDKTLSAFQEGEIELRILNKKEEIVDKAGDDYGEEKY